MKAPCELKAVGDVPNYLREIIADFCEWLKVVLRYGNAIEISVVMESMREKGDSDCVSLFRPPSKADGFATIKLFLEDSAWKRAGKVEPEEIANVLHDLARNLLLFHSLNKGLEWNKRFRNDAAFNLVLMYLDANDERTCPDNALFIRNRAKLAADEKIAILIDLECSHAARELLDNDTKRDHTWYVQMAETYEIEKDYEQAEAHYIQALEESPRCPYALWNYASCLTAAGRCEQGLEMLGRLGGISLKEVAWGPCGEGMRPARKLKNDALYLEARCLYKTGKFDRAKAKIDLFLQNRRQKRIGSVFSTKKATMLKSLIDAERRSLRC